MHCARGHRGSGFGGLQLIPVSPCSVARMGDRSQQRQPRWELCKNAGRRQYKIAMCYALFCPPVLTIHVVRGTVVTIIMDIEL